MNPTETIPATASRGTDTVCNELQAELRKVDHHLETDESRSAKLHLALPGVSREQAEIEILKNVLSVRASRSGGEARPVRYEFRTRLPDRFDPHALTASFSDGVLTLTLPLKETEKARQVPIA